MCRNYRLGQTNGDPGGRFRSADTVAPRNLGPLAGFRPVNGFTRAAKPGVVWATGVSPAGRFGGRFAERHGWSDAAAIGLASAVQ